MNNIFQYRETRDVVYDTYKRVEEMSAVLSKLGLFRGQFAGGVAITQGNRIFFQNTSGHGHWSIFASEGEDYWKFHDVLRGADLLVFESDSTIRVFPDTTPSTITIEDVFALAAGTALETWYLGDEEWYLGADEGAYFEFYSHNHATYPDELDLFTKELRITKYTFGTSPAVGPLKISGVTGTGDATNEVQIIANCGAEFIFGKTAPTHTKGGAAILWNKANTSMLFANNDTEVMRLTSDGNLCLGVNGTAGDRYLVLGHPTTSHTLVWDDFYINLKHGKVETGRINIGWESDDETYTRWYPSNSGYSNHIIDKALEVRQIPPTVAGTTTYGLRHRVQQIDGTSNYAAYVAQAGADTECFYIMKYATSHSSNPGRVSFWNQSNTDMLFLNNSTEHMRLTSGGNLCLGVTSTSGRVDIATNNGSSNYTRMTMFQARVTTSNATPTTLWSYTPTPGRTVMLEARVVARRTAGGGSAGDGAGYVVRAAYGITTGPTTTLFGTVDQWVREAVAGYDATFVIDGSNNIVLQVTGVAGTDISWQANIYLDIIGG